MSVTEAYALGVGSGVLIVLAAAWVLCLLARTYLRPGGS